MDERLRARILDQCQQLRKMIAELPRTTPNLLLNFSNVIVEIESTVQIDTDKANGHLASLFENFKSAPDGMGNVILNGDRHEKYFPETEL